MFVSIKTILLALALLKPDFFAVLFALADQIIDRNGGSSVTRTRRRYLKSKSPKAPKSSKAPKSPKNNKKSSAPTSSIPCPNYFLVGDFNMFIERNGGAAFTQPCISSPTIGDEDNVDLLDFIANYPIETESCGATGNGIIIDDQKTAMIIGQSFPATVAEDMQSALQMSGATDVSINSDNALTSVDLDVSATKTLILLVPESFGAGEDDLVLQFMRSGGRVIFVTTIQQGVSSVNAFINTLLSSNGGDTLISTNDVFPENNNGLWITDPVGPTTEDICVPGGVEITPGMDSSIVATYTRAGGVAPPVIVSDNIE